MHVVLNLEPGGTERLVIEITKAVAPIIDPFVCCLDEAGAWAGELAAIGVPVVALHREAGFHPRIGVAIARLADKYAIDVIHCHHYSPFVYGQIAACLGRRRLVFTEHGKLSEQPRSIKRRVLNPVLGRLPDAIFAVSAELRRDMIREGFPARRVRVLHNGIDPGIAPTPLARAGARRALGVSDERLMIGAAGRLDPVKDFPTLIRAVARLRRDDPTAQLAIIGDGQDRAALERFAAETDPGAVMFSGYRSDVRNLLPAMDLFANSSTHEGVSLTILEAMAAALPVIATRVGGTPEVVVDNETGLLVDAQNPDHLASALHTLARDPRRRSRMGEAGRLRMTARFSLDAMARGYMSAYLGEAV